MSQLTSSAFENEDILGQQYGHALSKTDTQLTIKPTEGQKIKALEIEEKLVNCNDCNCHSSISPENDLGLADEACDSAESSCKSSAYSSTASSRRSSLDIWTSRQNSLETAFIKPIRTTLPKSLGPSCPGSPNYAPLEFTSVPLLDCLECEKGRCNLPHLSSLNRFNASRTSVDSCFSSLSTPSLGQLHQDDSDSAPATVANPCPIHNKSTILSSSIRHHPCFNNNNSGNSADIKENNQAFSRTGSSTHLNCFGAQSSRHTNPQFDHSFDPISEATPRKRSVKAVVKSMLSASHIIPRGRPKISRDSSTHRSSSNDCAIGTLAASHSIFSFLSATSKLKYNRYDNFDGDADEDDNDDLEIDHDINNQDPNFAGSDASTQSQPGSTSSTWAQVESDHGSTSSATSTRAFSVPTIPSSVPSTSRTNIHDIEIDPKDSLSNLSKSVQSVVIAPPPLKHAATIANTKSFQSIQPVKHILAPLPVTLGGTQPVRAPSKVDETRAHALTDRLRRIFGADDDDTLIGREYIYLCIY